MLAAAGSSTNWATRRAVTGAIKVCLVFIALAALVDRCLLCWHAISDIPCIGSDVLQWHQ